MKVIYGFDALPSFNRPVATLGSFDGLHCGHRILLDNVIRISEDSDGESIVMTFEPHPRITLQNDNGLKLLTTLDEKIFLLEQYSIDYLLVIPFDKAFSQLSKERFVNEYLIDKLHISKFIIGYNHHFGCNKEGDYSFLSHEGRIDVIKVGQQLVGNDKVSSTVIRRTIERGDMHEAVRLLGHPYIITGNIDDNGVVCVDRYKLLPPDGEYVANINGMQSNIIISDNKINCKGLTPGKIILELN